MTSPLSIPPRRGHDLLAGLRRAAWAYGLGVVLLAAAVPAIDDLRALLRTLGIAALVLGAVITLATAYGRGPGER
jgi:hypothetical protein